MTAPIRDLLVTPTVAEASHLTPAEADLTWLWRQYHPDPWQQTAPDLARLTGLGERLFPLAFPNPAEREALFAALRGGPLRLWIRSEDPDLTRLPWEYLCVPQSLLDQAGLSAEDLGWPAATPPFLALHPKVSLVRRGTRALHPATIAAIGALRLLVVSANPNCAHWPDAAVYLDLEAIHTELRGVPASHLQIETLTGATRSALEARLAAFRPHLLHFAGQAVIPGSTTLAI